MSDYDNGNASQLQQYLGGGNMLTKTMIRVTKREALTARRQQNDDQIDRLTAENADIDEALGLLDQSPLMEKLDNLITKVLGR